MERFELQYPQHLFRFCRPAQEKFFVRNKNIKPQGTVVILTLFFLSITFGSFQTSSIRHASADSQPAASELIADGGGTMARSPDSADVKPVGEAGHSHLPAAAHSEPLKLLLLGSFLLLIATGIQMLSARKNKPKSKPA
ncbi:MAG TPA: hypothetical protein VKC34_12225 [Blastocatellia bacterium]|nr:hypothetical protein [Blastocatellia bacterium]